MGGEEGGGRGRGRELGGDIYIYIEICVVNTLKFDLLTHIYIYDFSFSASASNVQL
jgi:hypothetical protein